MSREVLVKLQIWRDRRGQISPLRIAALALLVWPLALAAWNAEAIMALEALTQSGQWSAYWKSQLRPTG